ncbi:uncharacterized protein BJ212DRAFT_1485500 [Suillus subaureus]|uniref:Uncharacterized protein n=1 Tax=Suillus subaureus TaxID=48587 RepID=A0A9P7E077_9AGAM|nr:uncharacterized protein BJ212DRAFT_1485500 [Suillus subaureus]KAG1807647.1 hypothetical protein BJ212DRAFT_1485500 [Suillus subaureus]
MVLNSNIVCQIGFLTFEHNSAKYSLYEIEPDSSGFLKDICAPFCGADLEGTLHPIWVLKQLKGILFNPAAFPNGFPSPTPIPINFPVEVPWNTLNPFSHQSITFPEMLLPPSLDFDHDPTIDLTVTSTLDNMFTPVLDDNSLMSATNFTYHQPIDEVEVPHEELHWREMLRGNPLDNSQKRSLKLILLTSPWGHLIRLARYLYVGQFLESPVDFISEMRKVVRGGTTPDAGFGNNVWQQAQLKLRIIDLLNSDDKGMAANMYYQPSCLDGTPAVYDSENDWESDDERENDELIDELEEAALAGTYMDLDLDSYDI